MMRLFRANAIVRKTVFLAVLFLWGGCTKNPTWLPEAKNLLENINREFEAVLPSLIQTTSPETLYVGLRRLDKWSDQILIEITAFFDKFPNVMREKVTIGFHLRKQLDDLGKNWKKAFVALLAWEKQIGYQKEFHKLGNSLVRKGDKVKGLLSLAAERANE
jgi:hypothetical protein